MEWLTGLKDGPLRMVQKLLEPKGELVVMQHAERHRDSLEALIFNNFYHNADLPAIYLYEQESEMGSQFGIWALTSLDDMLSGKIITHEDTLSEHREKISSYRTFVGLEGRPVLFSYEREETISGLAEQVSVMKPDISFSYDGADHRLWGITDRTILIALQQAFSGLSRVYVADGHHRLAAAAALHKQTPQWISTLYITTGQLRCREFHRMVLPKEKISEEHFLNYLRGYGFISEIPGNQPHRPQQSMRFGVCFQGKWYQFNLDPALCGPEQRPDVCFLQDEILELFFGISDPGADSRLLCWPANQWRELLAYEREHQQAIVFTLYAISPAGLVEIAENKTALPPKSTYTEPKIPYGLLIYDHRSN